MNTLSLGIMELLGVSLGVGQEYFRDFFQGNDSIMRLNYYPPCQKPDLTLGTGPHCDPTSLTILHQDHVSGLQVFVDEKWHSVTPDPEAFVVNIGDTFMVRPSTNNYGNRSDPFNQLLITSSIPHRKSIFTISRLFQK